MKKNHRQKGLFINDIGFTLKIMKIIIPVLLLGIGNAFSMIAPQATSLHSDINNKSIAQSLTVRGKVTDTSGEVLTGVSVILKGTSSGVITDIDGNYTMNAPTDGILEFSYIGYDKVEIPVNGKTTINVVMKESVQSIDEVVVVGYGVQKKENLTGAISSVNTEELTKISTSNLANAMAGKLPGLRVLQRNGEPGSYGTNIDIRGLGNALVVVDGVTRTDYNRIDPNDIESITILKDASASVYGLKAANGVILITTKKGEPGKITIQLTGTYGFSQPSNAPSTLNVYEQALLTTEASINAGQTPTYSKEQLETLRLNPNGTDWKKLVMKNHAPQQHYNLNISGGTEKTRYFMSAGTFLEDGLWKSDDLKYKRYNFRSNIVSEIFKGMKASLNIGGHMETKYAPLTGTFDILKSIWMHMPSEPAYANNNPEYLSNPGYTWNPIAFADADISGYSNFNRKNFQGTAALDYDIPFVKGLSIKLMFSYDYWANKQKNFRKKYALYTYDKDNDEYIPSYANSPSAVYQTLWDSSSEDLQFHVNYERSFGGHNLKGLFVAQQTVSQGDNFWAERQFDMDALDQLFAGSATNQRNGASTGLNDIYKFVSKGFVGRINYDYLSKYLIEVSARYDGSSKFPSGDRFGFFPAVTGGWRISEEKFFSDNISFVSNLMLRGSYGVMGDEDAGRFQHVAGFNYPSGNYIFGNTTYAGAKDKGAINPYLTWYKAKTANIGLDFSLWHGLLSGTAEIFQRKREGLMATRALTIPGTVGVGLPQENLNSDVARGFEIALSHINKIGDFNYAISGNITYTRNKWNYVERSQSVNSYDNYRNNSNNRYSDLWWGYQYAGRFTSFEQMYGHAIQDNVGNSTALPGDVMLVDLNQDGIIDSWDMKPICNNSTPLLNYAFNINMEYKGFDLSALFQGASKYNVKYAEQLAGPLSWGRNGLDMFMDRWHKEDMFDPDSRWIPGTYPSTRATLWAPNTWDSEYNIHQVTYLRLKSLEIGYTLPQSISRKAMIEKARIFINGFNLFTLSSVNSIIDPEQDAGSWGYTYPIMRNYNVGVSLTF